jgi:hypothetical protein
MASRAIAIESERATTTRTASRAGMTRAELLVRGFVLGLVVAAPAVAADAAAAKPGEDVALLTRSDFEPHLGDMFHVSGGPGLQMSARLVEIGDVSGAPDDERSFSLVLHDDRDVVLPQDIYEIWTNGMGTMELFIVPFVTLGRGQDYQIIFYRLPRAATSRP